MARLAQLQAESVPAHLHKDLLLEPRLGAATPGTTKLP
jgi:hypothetical protein